MHRSVSFRGEKTSLLRGDRISSRIDYQRRAMSTDVKSPAEILEIIRSRKSIANFVTSVPTRIDDSFSELKSERLVLPKIHSSSHSKV